MSFLICVQNFSSLAWIEVCQEPPVLEVILGGCWWFLTGYLDDGVILDVKYCHDMWFLTCIQNFSSLAWIGSVSRTPCPRSHTWRMLMVPDRTLGGWGYPWRHGSSWYMVLDLCAKFQLSSMIRSVSRTPYPLSPYLEDVDGSWLETWRMGSFLTSWVVIICDSWLVCQISAL